MQNTEFLFIYGSLRKRLRNPMHPVLGRYGKLVGEATLQAKLYDLGSYPGVVLSRDPTASVIGELYRVLDRERVFRTLDAYEGYNPRGKRRPLFQRRRVSVLVKTGRKAVTAWAYIYPRRIYRRAPIPSGDYLKHLKEKKKRTQKVSLYASDL